MEVRPTPTDEEAAAVAAALVLAWPEQAQDHPVTTSTRWRFSGRWWHHNPRRRRRP